MLLLVGLYKTIMKLNKIINISLTLSTKNKKLNATEENKLKRTILVHLINNVLA